MPKVKNSAANPESVVNQTQVLNEFLEDGHPNPSFFNKDGEGFEQIQAAIAEKGLWGEYFGKLYRVDPKRKVNDKPANVCKFANTLTTEEIQKRYGGKKWSVYMSRRVGTRDRMVGVFQFDIEAEPIWQDGEDPLDPPAKQQAAAVAAEGTTQLMGLFEKLLGDVLKQRDEASKEGRGFNAGDAFKEALATQKDSAAQAIAFVREQIAGKDNGMVDLVTKMMEKFMEKKESPLEGKLLDRLLDRAFGDGEKADPLEKITQWLDLADRLRDGKPSGPRGSGTDWGSIAGKVVDALPGLLQGAKELIQSAAAARGIQVPGAPPAGARAALLAGPGAQPAPQPSPALANGAGAAPLLTEDQASLIVVTRVKQMLVEKLFDGENGDAAAEVADAIHPAFAEHLAGVLKTDYAQLAGDPILSRAASHPNVLPFCKEYVAYFAEPGAEPPAGPVAVPPAPKPN